MSVKIFPIDPGDRLDYVFDFTKRMEKDADTIFSHEISVPDGIEMDGSTATDTLVRVWLQNAQPGSHVVRCKITTMGGRIYQRSVVLNGSVL